MLKRVVLYGTAAVMGILCAVVLSGIFAVTTVMGSGMEPAIESGSKVLINKLAYGIGGEEKPDIGNVVAFKSDVYGEEGEGSILVRRVAGAAGDTVEIRDDIFYLNGKPYTEYMLEPVRMEDMKKMELKGYEIFVLSDNRKSSMDSRNKAIGIVDSRKCIGKVCFW